MEGEAEQNPKAKYGYSRDGKPNCKQVVIALVMTPTGLPMAYEVMDGNTSDKTVWRQLLFPINDNYSSLSTTTTPLQSSIDSLHWC